jgi:hypothetical protein
MRSANRHENPSIQVLTRQSEVYECGEKMYYTNIRKYVSIYSEMRFFYKRAMWYLNILLLCVK